MATSVPDDLFRYRKTLFYRSVIIIVAAVVIVGGTVWLYQNVKDISWTVAEAITPFSRNGGQPGAVDKQAPTRVDGQLGFSSEQLSDGRQAKNEKQFLTTVRAAGYVALAMWFLWVIAIPTILLAAIYIIYRGVYRSEYNMDQAIEARHMQPSGETSYRVSFYRTIYSLNTSIVRSYLLGYLTLYIGLFIFFILAVMVYALTSDNLETMAAYKADNTVDAVVHIFPLAVRASLLGMFILGALLHAFKFAKASFDQAVRFNKRKLGALFFSELLGFCLPAQAECARLVAIPPAAPASAASGQTAPPATPAPGLAQSPAQGCCSINATVALALKAFNDWNENVESAYTDQKLDRKMTKSMLEMMLKRDSKTMELFLKLCDQADKKKDKKDDDDD